jgi:hypothetical protein
MWFCGHAGPAWAQASPGYEDLVAVFQDFRETRSPEAWSGRALCSSSLSTLGSRFGLLILASWMH